MGAAIYSSTTDGGPVRSPRPLGTGPNHLGERLSPDQWRVIATSWALVGTVAVSELVGVLPSGIAPIFGLAIAAMFGLAFLFRFWPTLIALLVLRPTLDVFKDPESGGGIDVTLLVGFIFLGAATVWLVARAADGTLRRPTAPTLTFAAFALAGGVASLGAMAPVVALQSTVKLVSAVLMLAVLEQVLRDNPRRLPTVVTAAVWSLALPAFGGVYQYLKGPEQGDWVNLGRVSSTFVHPNAFATYLMFIGLFAIAVRTAATPKIRFAAGVAGLIAVPLLYVTLARSAAAGLVVGLVIIAWQKNRRLLWLVPVGLAVVLALPTTRERLADLTKEDDVTLRGNANSLSWRLEYWDDVAPMFLDSPIIGIGPAMVSETHPDHFEPHNTILQSVVEFGVLGSALFASFFVTSIAALRRAWRRGNSPLVKAVALGGMAMVGGYLTQAPVENVMFQVVLWWYLVIPIATASIVTASDRLTESS